MGLKHRSYSLDTIARDVIELKEFVSFKFFSEVGRLANSASHELSQHPLYLCIILLWVGKSYSFLQGPRTSS